MTVIRKISFSWNWCVITQFYSHAAIYFHQSKHSQGKKSLLKCYSNLVVWVAGSVRILVQQEFASVSLSTAVMLMFQFLNPFKPCQDRKYLAHELIICNSKTCTSTWFMSACWFMNGFNSQALSTCSA